MTTQDDDASTEHTPADVDANGTYVLNAYGKLFDIHGRPIITNIQMPRPPDMPGDWREGAAPVDLPYGNPPALVYGLGAVVAILVVIAALVLCP
jgi:hypothetical protein